MSALDPTTATPAPTASERARLEQLKARRASAAKPSAPAVQDPAAVRLRTVRELYALGVRFIPLNGKVPRPGIAGWNRADYSHSLEQAEQWARESNVGMIGGRLIVLDIDKRTPEVEALVASLPTTVRARTGKGSHLYFLAPDGVTLGNATGALPKGIDVRGAGGYAVAPGSIHPDTGQPYAWEAGCAPWEIDFAPLPEAVVALIKAPKRAPSPRVECQRGAPLPVASEALASFTAAQRKRVASYVEAIVVGELEKLRVAEDGTRNSTLNNVALRLGHLAGAGLIDEDEIAEKLAELAHDIGLEPREIEATIRSGMTAGVARPEDIPALLARLEEGDRHAEHFVAGFRTTTAADKDAEFRERRDGAIAAINAALTEAVQAGRSEPLLRPREEWGFLALHDAQAIASLRTTIKAHKDDLRGFKLGDLDVFLKEARQEVAELEAAAEVERLGRQDERPMVAAFGDPLDMIGVSVEALAALNTRGPLPVLFLRSGSLVMVGADGRVVPVGREELGFLLAQTCRFFRKTDAGSVRIVDAPFALLNSLGASLAFAGRLPELDFVGRAPILAPSGKPIEHGYDRETKTLVVASVKLDISEQPTQEQARAAVGFLQENILGRPPCSGFPFADEASQANALALFLTPVLRSAIDGPVPMAVIDAPAQSTGKTLLATIAMVVATGSCDTAHLPFDDRELQRDILAPAFNEARSMLILDNLVREVDSPLLAKVLTDRESTFRAYHTQTEVRGPNRLFIVGTGNNVRLGTDLVRRSFRINLDAKTPTPDARSGFRHADLHHWVRGHRAEVLSALFTIARAWYAAGQPEATVPTLGSYREWTRIIGGVLAFAGVRGFLGNIERNRASDRGGEEIEEFLRFLAEQGFAGRTFTARDVCALSFSPAESLSSHFRPQDIGDPRTVARRLGIVLLQVEGRRYGTEADCLWIARATDERGRLLKNSQNSTLWLLHREHLGG